MKSRHGLMMSACMMAGSAILGATQGLANDELAKLSKDPNQWVMPLGNYSSQRFSELAQINTKTAKNLHPVWTFSTGVLRGHEGGPLVIGDMMYISTPFPNTVFALSLKDSGKIAWKYEPTQDANVIPVMCCDTVNRGVAYSPDNGGMIFLHQADTTLVALNAQTGKVCGRSKTATPARGDGHVGPVDRQGQGDHWRQRRRVRHSGAGSPPTTSRTAARPWVAYRQAPTT